ncbi:MAG: 1-acyl-sn-glycerol-3-phosphate acyltransferase [Deltaproteobacteria bacterium]|nr:1-acyl-sn-glycerol-3-phosphate acyltransferase [Deltaproteobacteria bacterium]
MLRCIGRSLYAIYSPFFALQLGVNTVVLGICCLITILVTGQGRAAHWIGRFWSRYNMLLSGVRVTLRGAEHIVGGQHYVVMANHQSLYDVWAAIGWLPLQLRFLVKHTMRSIPLVGFTIGRMGHIYVDRGSSDSAAHSLSRAADRIHGGISVFFFPEGTRSPDGRLIEFKSGGFRLAQAAGVPILPVTINGGRKIWRRGSLRLLPGAMDVTVHAAIPVAVAGSDDRSARQLLMQQVRAAIEADLRVG